MTISPLDLGWDQGRLIQSVLFQIKPIKLVHIWFIKRFTVGHTEYSTLFKSRLPSGSCHNTPRRIDFDQVVEYALFGVDHQTSTDCIKRSREAAIIKIKLSDWYFLRLPLQRQEAYNIKLLQQIIGDQLITFASEQAITIQNVFASGATRLVFNRDFSFFASKSFKILPFSNCSRFIANARFNTVVDVSKACFTRFYIRVWQQIEFWDQNLRSFRESNTRLPIGRFDAGFG